MRSLVLILCTSVSNKVFLTNLCYVNENIVSISVVHLDLFGLFLLFVRQSFLLFNGRLFLWDRFRFLGLFCSLHALLFAFKTLTKNTSTNKCRRAP